MEYRANTNKTFFDVAVIDYTSPTVYRDLCKFLFYDLIELIPTLFF